MKGCGFRPKVKSLERVIAIAGMRMKGCPVPAPQNAREAPAVTP